MEQTSEKQRTEQEERKRFWRTIGIAVGVGAVIGLMIRCRDLDGRVTFLQDALINEMHSTDTVATAVNRILDALDPDGVSDKLNFELVLEPGGN